MKLNKSILYLAVVILSVLSACKEEETEAPLRIAFQEFNGALNSADTTLAIKVVASKAVDQTVGISLGLSSSCAAGIDNLELKDAQGETLNIDSLTLTIAAGSNSTTILVGTKDGAFPSSTQAFVFDLLNANNAQLNDTHLSFELLVGSNSGFFSNSYSNSFEVCPSELDDFVVFNGSGSMTNRPWRCTTDSNTGEYALLANGFGGDAETLDTWLVSSKKLNFVSTSAANIGFDAKSEFSGDGELEILWSSSYCGAGAPNIDEWTNLSTLESQLPEKGSKNYKTISANVTTVLGQSGYIAFRFSGATKSGSSSYSIDNFKLGATSNGGNGNTASSFVTGFESCSDDFAIPDGFIEEFLTAKTDRGWGCRGFGVDDSRAVQASAFGGSEGNDNAWLIIEDELDFTSLSSVNVKFDMYSNFSGPGEVIVQYATDYSGSGSPEAATWIPLSAINDAMPAAGSQEWTSINEDIDALGGKTVHIAFQFVGANNTASSSWALDNLAINGEGSSGGGGSGGGGSTGASYSTDFEGCSEDFSTPSGFSEYFLTAKTDRGWGCRPFGLEDSRAVQASAFGGAEGSDNAWLVLDNSLDFTGLSSVNFQFQMFSNFSGPGEVIAQYSTDYSGTGSPDAANWTAISVINNAMPAAGSQEWTAINENVSELGGKTVYIAFQFVGANNTASSSWAIDNLAINDEGAFTGSGGGTGGGSGSAEGTIADAKTKMGETVTVTGIVTTPDYGFNNGQYFIQDETAGINIFHSGNFGLVSVGDEVTITGEIGDFNSLTQLSPTQVTVNSSGNSLPSPSVIGGADLVASSNLMGSYIQLNNVSLIDATEWPTEPIDASSGLNVSATVDGVEFIIRIDRGESFYDGSSAPSGSFTLRGILGRFNEDVQVLPFLEGDVE